MKKMDYLKIPPERISISKSPYSHNIEVFETTIGLDGRKNST